MGNRVKALYRHELRIIKLVATGGDCIVAAGPRVQPIQAIIKILLGYLPHIIIRRRQTIFLKIPRLVNVMHCV
jgi:hypothetical protein